MGKCLVITRYIISTICVVTLLWGCDRTVDATVSSKVVRKKVSVEQRKIADAGSDHQVVRSMLPAPAYRSEKKATTVKADKKGSKPEKQPIPRTKMNGQVVIAKKIEGTPVAESASKPPPLKKSAVSPRSDISDVQQPTTVNTASPGDNLIAATSNVTRPAKPSAGLIPDKYVASGKIDPFEPLFKDKPVSVKEKKPKKRTPMTPLERIDLSQLKLVGIIMASSGNRALVEESSGKGYVIRKGTYIGINSGKVVKIVKEKVLVEEEFEDVFGKTKLRQREITLPKPSGEF